MALKNGLEKDDTGQGRVVCVVVGSYWLSKRDFEPG